MGEYCRQCRQKAANCVCTVPEFGPDPYDEIKRLRKALEFYRDGFRFHPQRTKTGVNISEWRPTEGLLDDCGNTAKTALEPVEPTP